MIDEHSKIYIDYHKRRAQECIDLAQQLEDRRLDEVDLGRRADALSKRNIAIGCALEHLDYVREFSMPPLLQKQAS